MFDNSSPNAQWVIVRRERDEFVKSCIKTSFMAQYSKDVAYWNNLGDKYDLRLADPKNTVSNVTELRTAEILSGDAGELKMVTGMDGLNFSSAKVQKFVDLKHWHHS